MFGNKNVVVTGGSRGIGKAIVEQFAAHGANVHFSYIHNELAAFELKSEMEQKYKGQVFSAIHCDISQNQQVESMFDQHLDPLSSIDFLINNAGITDDGLMIMMDVKQWENVIQTNLTGAFYLTQKVSFKMLRNRSGNIINISSVAGVYGNAGQCNYAAAKAGLIGMSKSLSKELAQRNIRVNAIAPGFIETDMTRKLSDNDRKVMLDKIGLKRFGLPQDVANACVFLASPQANYITGQTLVIDGGLVL